MTTSLEGIQTAPSTAVTTVDEVCKILLDKKQLFMSLILRIENDWNTAEDIFALATVDAVAHAAARFKGESSLISYLGAIVVNTARQHARRQATRKNTVGMLYDHELSANVDETFSKENSFGMAEHLNPESILESRQTLARVQRLLLQLQKRWPDAYSTWSMYRLDEMSYQEIEDVTGLAPATARARVHRVSQALEELSKENSNLLHS